MDISNSADITFFDVRELPCGKYCFAGFSGSGTATAMLTLAHICSRSLKKKVVIENWDLFHIGKNNQIQTLAMISDLPFRSDSDSNTFSVLYDTFSFIYMQGLASVDDLADRVENTARINADVVLVVDCSRHPKINERLLTKARDCGITYIILTKLDLAPDPGYINVLLASYSYRVLLASQGERIPNDFNTRDLGIEII